jgi:hypothetical protein
MPPPIPEALELYLKMMEGLDLKWAVGCPLSEKSIMDTPWPGWHSNGVDTSG